jgi:hypothetical protein
MEVVDIVIQKIQTGIIITIVTIITFIIIYYYYEL